MKIANVVSQSVYDSAGWPTLKVSLILDDETMFSAYTPLSWKACIPNLDVLSNDEQFELKLKYLEKITKLIENELQPILVGKTLQREWAECIKDRAAADRESTNDPGMKDGNRLEFEQFSL